MSLTIALYFSLSIGSFPMEIIQFHLIFLMFHLYYPRNEQTTQFLFFVGRANALINQAVLRRHRTIKLKWQRERERARERESKDYNEKINCGYFISFLPQLPNTIHFIEIYHKSYIISFNNRLIQILLCLEMKKLYCLSLCDIR